MTSLKNIRLTCLGAGNMAEALLRGLVRSGSCAPDRITVTDVRDERLAFMRKAFGVNVSFDNRAAVRDADVVLLAVKPQVIDEVLVEVKATLPADALLLSIAAGKHTAGIEKTVGRVVRVVRAMPNTPALIGAGASAICPGRHAGAADLALAEALLSSVGTVVLVSEEAMDAVTALSGSGPAYVFYLIEAMLAAAQRMALDPETARKLTLATVSGAARLIAETGEEAGSLRERVTSKGGTTAAALDVMAQRGVMDAVVEAILAAQARSRALSSE